MENSWIFFALGSMLILGAGDFIKKLVLSKGGDKDVFLLVCFLMYIPLFWINAYFQGTGIYDSKTINAAFVIGVDNFGALLGITTALKYLNVSFVLVFIRIISSFFILFIGLYILGDKLSSYNIIGFLVGAFAIFLLSGFKFAQKIELPLKGMVATIAATVSIIFLNSYYKYVIEDVQVHDYTALQFSITGTFLFVYMFIRGRLSHFSQREVGKIFPYALITISIFSVFFLYFMPNMYLSGTLSLSYKILSYSLIVPIFLSVLFLGEKVTKTRIIAFGLTIISIFLFLI